MAKRFVYWALPDGQHFDRELGFHVRQGEIKRLPDVIPAGSLTQQRLDMRALIECDPPAETRLADPVAAHEDERQEAGSADAEEIQASPDVLATAAQEIIERRIAVLQADFTAAQLRDLAAEMCLIVNPKANKQALATTIAAAEWQREHRE